MRRAWIEITQRRDFKSLCLVALLAESVDRNTDQINFSDIPAVALLAESVDRNTFFQVRTVA